MDNDMVRRLDRIREIGCEIARLSEEAKTLRGEVVAILNRSTHAPQPGNPTRMLHGESVVTVALSKDEKCKDVSVTFEDLDSAADIAADATPF